MKPRATPLETLARHPGLAGMMLVAAGGIVILVRATDPAWWPARLTGLVALLSVAAALVVRPARVRPRWHDRLGWVALAALAGHVGLVAGQQPVFWRWLTLAIPVELIAGVIAAGAFLAVLLPQRSRRFRRRFGPSLGHRLHHVAAHVVAAAAGAHVAMVAGVGALAIGVILAGLAILLAEGILCERDGRALAVTLVILATTTAVFTMGPFARPRLEPLRRSPVDSANYLHSDHVGLACAGCHHNFVDQTGRENCLTCHKRISVSETMRIDRVFHVSCGSCHRADRQAGRESGPIDDCNGCHASRSAGSAGTVGDWPHISFHATMVLNELQAGRLAQ